MTEERHRLVIVGGGSVGKSCLVIRYLQGKFIEDYDPTIEENYRKMVIVDDKACMLEILDTAGQEEYRTVRDKYLKEGEGFLVVFSVISQSSLQEAREFHTAIRQAKNAGDTPTVTLGNKADLTDERQIEGETGEELAKEFSSKYFDTSALTGLNVTEAFEGLVRILRTWKKKKLEPEETKEGGNTKKKPAKKKGGLCNLL
ncbi:ras-like protein [Anaeramoeba flamelloides]|uniref:Ras-like protein n=1 Tax=Anaeramoeba flamelloides TaxID=1746091 RepID=A0AAV7ZTD4_9EUKA|nr:ras-like protein [Anaeramoeba flamelloides]|eukprot:Anaeramoba_flamelloidesa327982_133.p1 GENE.a327982_133~~a327982_133.p1  ORF type:complete len:201 (+),score=43.78 a327982_133:19-621(+)